jgi:predicted DNA-binding ribbon-helix-helix protein
MEEASPALWSTGTWSTSGHRTNMRLEASIWDALDEITDREGKTLHGLYFVIDGRRDESNLTAAIRVFILNYFRSAATDISHIRFGYDMRDTNDSGLERNRLFGDAGRGPGLREEALPPSYSLE